MSISISISGIPQMIAKMEAERKKIREAFNAAIYAKGLAIMTTAEPMTPHKHGRLRQSAYVAPPVGKGDDVTVELGYGVLYAPIVHEMTGPVNWTRPGSGPKFLQRAIDQHVRGFATWIKNKAWEFYKKGIGMGSVPASFPRKPKV